MVSALLVAGTALAFVLLLECQVRLAALHRRDIAPHAERLLIEKRWLEHHAPSPAAFARRWRAEIDEAYRRHVPRRHRLLFTLTAWERALNGAFAGITAQEIASWTFIDRASRGPESFETLVSRCLDRLGWQVSPLSQGAGSELLLSDARQKIAVSLSYAVEAVECRVVQEAAAAAVRARCQRACIVTNGRFGGAARTLAEALDVTLLHCSQMDQLVPAAAPARRATQRPALRLAA